MLIWKFVRAGAAASALIGILSAVHADEVSPTDGLRAAYPGVRVMEAAPRMRAVFGRPMMGGESPAGAAEAFLMEHGEALGAPHEQLILDWSCDVNFGKFTVFNYRQEIAGLSVEYGQAVVLVNNALGRVVFASGTLAGEPAGGGVPEAEARVDPGQAIDAISAMPAYRHRNITQWQDPELVVFFGEHTKGDAHVAWRLTGWNPEPGSADAYSFFVDAGDGRILHVRHDVAFGDVGGSVMGMATPNLYPDTPENPPVPMPIGGVKVTHLGGGAAYSGLDGSFVIPYAGTGPVTAITTANTPEWGTIEDPDVTVSVTGVAGIPMELFLNPEPTEFRTAVMNIARVVPITRAYVLERAPGFNALTPIKVEPNISNNCFARYFFASGLTQYTRKNEECNNTAFSTLISHEYGHHMVQKRRLVQDSFGEGFSDLMSHFVFNTRQMGLEFTIGVPVRRDPIASNVQYPCTEGELHACGMLVGGVWWRVKEAFESLYGPVLGLELIRQFQIDWYLTTAGGAGQWASMHPMSAVEMLALDDDDGDLYNGTPHFTQIRAAFEAHSIPVDIGYCYADCDQSGTIDLFDVICYLNKLDAGEAGADCTGEGDLDFFDVLCFLNEFNGGCE